MVRLHRITTILLLIFAFQTSAQTTALLLQNIEQIIASKNAVVGVSIIGPKAQDTLSINGGSHLPMQSVFKFHIALALLSEVDKGRFSLDQKININKADLLPGTHSPMRDKYPDGASLSISEILKYTVSSSDNNGCDILLRLIGGPQTVEDYFAKNNFKDFSIKINEETMHGEWEQQFRNWTTPIAASGLLSAFYDKHQTFLSTKSYSFIWKLMKETTTGPGRLKGQLPEGTIVAHKTGSSGSSKEGITAALNDIGIVFLPKGQHFVISVFVSNSKEDEKTNEKIIADIAKSAWDFFTAREE